MHRVSSCHRFSCVQNWSKLRVNSIAPFLFCFVYHTVTMVCLIERHYLSAKDISVAQRKRLKATILNWGKTSFAFCNIPVSVVSCSATIPSCQSLKTGKSLICRCFCVHIYLFIYAQCVLLYLLMYYFFFSVYELMCYLDVSLAVFCYLLNQKGHQVLSVVLGAWLERCGEEMQTNYEGSI